MPLKKISRPPNAIPQIQIPRHPNNIPINPKIPHLHKFIQQWLKHMSNTHKISAPMKIIPEKQRIHAHENNTHKKNFYTHENNAYTYQPNFLTHQKWVYSIMPTHQILIISYPPKKKKKSSQNSSNNITNYIQCKAS